MNMDILNKISSLTRDEDVVYVAYGKFTQSILQSVVATAKKGIYDSVTKKEHDAKKIDSLITIAIEMMQNVRQYREEIDNYNNDLILITTNENIMIHTSNLSNAQGKDNISKNIDFLNSLDKADLRKHSREAMKRVSNKDDNSAGLGLIEVANLSSEDIKYEFIPYRLNDNLFHFNMSVVI